jgi:hypothetical protein
MPLLILLFIFISVLPVQAQWAGMEPPGSMKLSDWDMTNPKPMNGNHVPYSNGWTAYTGKTQPASNCAELVSPCDVMQLNFAGVVGGSSPGNHYYSGAEGKNEVFVGYSFSTSNPFTSNIAGTKTFFVMSNNGAWNVIPHLHVNGDVNGPWTISFYYSSGNPAIGVPGAYNCHLPNLAAKDCPGSVHIMPNVGDGTVRPGVQYKIASYVKLSSCPTCQDGILRMWLNGVMTHNLTTVNFPANAPIGQVQINPTWGGSVGTATYGYFQYGHVYVSAPNCPAPCGQVVNPPPVQPPPVQPPPQPPVNAITDLRVTGITSVGGTVLATVPDGYRIFIRVAPSPINWGGTLDQACVTTPCPVSGLNPRTNHQVQAVLQRQSDSTFGPITNAVSFTTLDGPVNPPPVQPPPVQPPPVTPPPQGPAFKNLRQGEYTDKKGRRYDAIYYETDCDARRIFPGEETEAIICQK